MVEWLNQRIFCNCAKCKGAIVRIRRVTRQHQDNHGLWEAPSRRDSLDEDEDIEEAVRRTAVQTMPHYSVMSGRQRRQAKVHQERGHGSQAEVEDNPSESNEAHEDHMEDEHMEEIMRDFFETHVPIGDEGNTEGDEPHRPLYDAAKVPLYEGSQYSILRACLEILNLQTIYGWSNASVTSLLKDRSKCEETPTWNYGHRLYKDLVVFHPDINDPRRWYVIQVSPRGRAIYQEQDVDRMEEVGVDDDVNVEVEAAQYEQSDTIRAIGKNMVDEELNDIVEDDPLEDDNIHIDDDGDDSSVAINLFVDLASLGLDLDQDTCRDLCDDSREL
ncbi:hypothetical protein L7F22_015410 [Adiantum nelumboides]|nr:hypothetical protein [Adiantum nelumboides]